MYSEAESLIEQRIKDNWSSTPVSYDNQPYVPKKGDSYVRLQTEWVDASLKSVGGRTVGSGFILVSVFTPRNVGTRPAVVLADAIASLLNRFKSGALRCNVARVQRVGNIDEWFQLNVITPYTYDQCYVI